MKKTKYLHIAIIILGIIFITIPVFHNNLWFDESYSVGMANKSFIDIWQIGSNPYKIKNSKFEFNYIIVL